MCETLHLPNAICISGSAPRPEPLEFDERSPAPAHRDVFCHVSCVRGCVQVVDSVLSFS